MSLTRPILLTTTSFDADKNKVFTFDVGTGGSQIVANKLTIRNQDDNKVVYDQKQATFKYEHILPAGTLINGQYYNAVVTVFDRAEEESPASNPIQFRCYTTPVISFTNFPTTGIVNNASYEFKFEYTQLEGERLDSYIVNLYDITNSLVSTSGNIYVQDGTPPYDNSYLFTGFVDDTAYYVEVVGITINGAIVKSEKKLFNVDYKQPDLFTLLELENNCDGGYITISSNIVLIDGVFNPRPPIFIDDKEIDLRGNKSFIKWPNGYAINGDFLVRAWFRNPNLYTTLVTMSNASGQTISISFMKGYENAEAQEMKVYVQMTVKSIEGMEYYIYSNYIPELTPSEYYSLHCERIGNVYQLKLIEKAKEVA